MRKSIILLLISLQIPIWCSSQTILKDSVIISKEQLKIANLIFNEHSKLLKENKIYKSQLADYDSLVNNYHCIDSLKSIKLQECTKQLSDSNSKLDKVTKRSKLAIFGLSIVSIVSILFNIL